MQISKALLGDEDRLRLPRFMEEEEDPEARCSWVLCIAGSTSWAAALCTVGDACGRAKHCALLGDGWRP